MFCSLVALDGKTWFLRQRVALRSFLPTCEGIRIRNETEISSEFLSLFQTLLQVQVHKRKGHVYNTLAHTRMNQNLTLIIWKLNLPIWPFRKYKFQRLHTSLHPHPETPKGSTSLRHSWRIGQLVVLAPLWILWIRVSSCDRLIWFAAIEREYHKHFAEERCHGGSFQCTTPTFGNSLGWAKVTCDRQHWERGCVELSRHGLRLLRLNRSFSLQPHLAL